MSAVTGPDPSISLQRRDGVWEKLGTSVGGYGIVPESIQWSHSVSQGGPTSLTFRLNQDPRRKRNDLEQFTPVSVKVGSGDEWSGRIISLSTARGDEQTINVECEGWYQHTKDWSYDKKYVSTDLSKFVDAREQVTAASLAGATPYSAGGQVSSGDGKVYLGFQKGYTTTNSERAAANIDLGPNCVGKRLVITYESSNNSANSQLYAILATDSAAASNDNASVANNAGATGTLSISATTSDRRFVQLLHYVPTGGLLAADVWFRITGVLVAADTAYESGNASILKASTVIGDVLTNRCPLISTDQSLITATSFSIPNYAPDPGRFPNEHIDAVNSYHGWNFYMTPEPTPRAVYEALPTVPAYALGAGDSYKFTSPAERNGRETYSLVTLSYQDATGVPAWATIGSATGASFVATSDISFTNPSFDTNTTGWTLGGFARSTVDFNTTPASILSSAPPRTAIATAFTGSLVVGKRYRIRFYAKTTGGAGVISGAAVTMGGVDTNVIATGSTITSATWSRYSFDFTATSTTLSAFTLLFSGAETYLDDFSFEVAAGTVVDRRGFSRELVVSPSGPLTSAAATQIAQTILDARQLPPLKGTLEAPEGVREYGTGRHIPAYSVRSGKAIILEDEQDPNTGAFGRIGVIQTATYNHDSRTVTLEIDSATDFVDQLLNRIGAGRS